MRKRHSPWKWAGRFLTLLVVASGLWLLVLYLGEGRESLEHGPSDEPRVQSQAASDEGSALPPIEAVQTPLASGPQVRGFILDDAGQPLANASISNGWELLGGAPPARTVLSEADGSFVLPLAELVVRATRGSAVLVIKTATDDLFVHEVLGLREQPTQGVGSLRVARTAHVTGQIVDGQGQASKGARVSYVPQMEAGAVTGTDCSSLLTSWARDELRQLVERLWTSDATQDGTFYIHGLPDGAGSVLVEAPTAKALLIDIQSSCGSVVDLGQVRLPASEGIFGRVLLSDRSPASGIAVCATPESPQLSDHESLFEVFTDENGSFSLSNLPDGRYTLSTFAPAHVFAHIRGVPTGARDVAIQLELGGTVEVEAADAETGAPLQAAVVTAELPPEARLAPRWSDEQLVVELLSVPERALIQGIGLEGVVVTVTAPGYASLVEMIPGVAAGSRSNKQVLLVPRDKVLRGRVHTGTGVGVAGALIEAQLEGLVERASTDGAGNFTLPGLMSGEWEVTVVAEGFRRYLLPSVVVPREEYLQICLDKASRLEGRVVDAVGAAVPANVAVQPVSLAVQSLGECQETSMSTPRYGARTEIVAAAAGAFLLDDIAPGEYMLYPSRLPANVQKRQDENGSPLAGSSVGVPVTIRSSESKAIDFVVPLGATLTGNVTLGGRAATGASVSCRILAGEQLLVVAETLADANGQFAFEELDAATYVVAAISEESLVPVCIVVEARAGATERLSLELAGALIRGMVREVGTERPVSDVPIRATRYLPATPGAESSILSRSGSGAFSAAVRPASLRSSRIPRRGGRPRQRSSPSSRRTLGRDARGAQGSRPLPGPR